MKRLSRLYRSNTFESQHPEKLLSFARHLDENVLAAIYGIDLETYRNVKFFLAQQAKEAARQLLQDPVFADRVDRLPFLPGETVIGARKISKI